MGIIFFLFMLKTEVSVAQSPLENSGGLHQQQLPVTRMPFNDDKGKLQFAIISDLWGGYRPGIIEDAVSKIGLLQPQFVISVGDLIDGNSYDSTVINDQWNDFNNKIRPLSMPFFYVPGNHDIGSPMMERQWQRKVGKAYYYFIYKNALFLCVNTQDGGRSGIDDKQILYFKKAIEDHPEVRWTFVFMHRPVWLADGNRQEGYEKIETALTGRNYTLFSGHYHTYLNKLKNGNKHFILGSTGGGSDLRGEKFGEFDHITWVTLNEKESPKIINLKLDGMIKEDVVNEKTFPITNTLINEDWLITTPYVLPHQLVKSISSKVIFDNAAPYPLSVHGSMPDVKGYSINPKRIEITIPPKSRKEQAFDISAADDTPVDIAALPSIDLLLNGSYTYDTTHYTLPAHKKLYFDWQRRLPQITDAKTLARKNFQNGDTSGFVSITNPEYLQNKWYWHGPADGLVSYKVTHDGKYLYLLVFIKDDQLIFEGKTDQRDLVYFHFEDKNDSAVQFTVVPSRVDVAITKKASKSILNSDDVRIQSAIERDRLKIILQLPLNKIMKQDHSVRFNIGYRDQDNHPEKQNSTLFWKPVWDTENDYSDSGSFILDFHN
jgi:hypothetical protein